MKKNNVIFTPDDIHNLFKIGELLDDLECNISKYNAISDILVEALTSCKNEEVTFTSDTLFWVAFALRDYSNNAKDEVSIACDKYNQLYSEKRELCFGCREV